MWSHLRQILMLQVKQKMLSTFPLQTLRIAGTTCKNQWKKKMTLPHNKVMALNSVHKTKDKGKGWKTIGGRIRNMADGARLMVKPPGIELIRLRRWSNPSFSQFPSGSTVTASCRILMRTWKARVFLIMRMRQPFTGPTPPTACMHSSKMFGSTFHSPPTKSWMRSRRHGPSGEMARCFYMRCRTAFILVMICWRICTATSPSVSTSSSLVCLSGVIVSCKMCWRKFCPWTIFTDHSWSP